ncbi:hypothetical protein QJ856_gp0286 [Tupanvirus deep ocean]|uniref:Uncharacterized protein n=2 Tax=Tupanvirus TaxID=2094720 RepID=A0AC62A9Z5_9VIRU|nr:hypothetical protein QJ856_gp0286 [Tupanvirus deep ocean]QKU34448.1 hypothetical protein [Tupanvirus deep ocean]
MMKIRFNYVIYMVTIKIDFTSHKPSFCKNIIACNFFIVIYNIMNTEVDDMFVDADSVNTGVDNITFAKKYPHLSEPLTRRDICKNTSNPKYWEHNKYDFSKPSPLNHAAATSIIGTRSTMEDTYVITRFENGAEFYGVFDGHGGWQYSVFLENELTNRLSQAATLANLNCENPTEVTEFIKNFCHDLGREFYEIKDCLDTGSTAVFALKYKKFVYVVNIGDSAIFIFDSTGKILLKTEGHKHKPHYKDEKERITKCGSYVSCGRVEGELAVSRAFGDNKYSKKIFDNYPGSNGVVIVEPLVYTFELPEHVDLNNHIYMVAGSDGLWDYCLFDPIPKQSSDENSESSGESDGYYFPKMVEIITSNPPKEASQKLVHLAYNTPVRDNITAVVVNLTN